MTPRQMIVMAANDGVTMTLTDKGRIRLSGNQLAIDRWLQTVNQYRVELVTALSELEPA